MIHDLMFSVDKLISRPQSPRSSRSGSRCSRRSSRSRTRSPGRTTLKSGNSVSITAEEPECPVYRVVMLGMHELNTFQQLQRQDIRASILIFVVVRSSVYVTLLITKIVAKEGLRRGAPDILVVYIDIHTSTPCEVFL